MGLLLNFVFEICRPPSELMNWMKPIFKLDTKTQRSFMACLKLDDLDMVMNEKNIFVEIKLATLHHYFENCLQQEVRLISIIHFVL